MTNREVSLNETDALPITYFWVGLRFAPSDFSWMWDWWICFLFLLQISSRKVENGIRTLEVNQVVKMHNSGHYYNDDRLSSKNSRVGCARQLTLIWMERDSSALCLPSSSSHLNPPVWGSYRRGSSEASWKDRKWLIVPPGVRWVGSEGRLGERTPD